MYQNTAERVPHWQHCYFRAVSLHSNTKSSPTSYYDHVLLTFCNKKTNIADKIENAKTGKNSQKKNLKL